MIIREPLVHATYYYLRESPGESPARRHDRHEAFVSDTRRILRSISGWLALPEPLLPELPIWNVDAPSCAHELMQTGELQGRINASAWLYAYVLRNMLLLRVVVARAGEYEQTVWPLLDESLGEPPTTPSWLHVTRYWCGLAPRPPEDLEQDRSLPIHTPFGVLCLGQAQVSHLLVYPDARTEQRASSFLEILAPELDWYTVQARYCLDRYENHASTLARARQYALDQVVQSMQSGPKPDERHRLNSLAPLRAELGSLEAAYRDALTDLDVTGASAQELQQLSAGYHLKLMQSGLWDAAPSVWQAQIGQLTQVRTQLEADMQHINASLRHMNLMIQTLHIRIALLQGERDRLLIYLIAALGLAILAVLVADTNLGRVAIRLLALAVVVGLVWIGWQVWLRARSPDSSR
jgi:hypothetical protein